MLAELLATDGVVEHCELRSAAVGFLAIHGGLEAATFEIAHAVARRSNASLYAVVQPPDLQWHVPSHRYRTELSAKLSAFCQHVDVSISLHGYGGIRDCDDRWTTVAIGGARRDLAHKIGVALSENFGERYRFVSDIVAVPSEYRGLHADNPVNQTRGGGVQIELPPRIRGNSPVWHETPRNDGGFVPDTEVLIETLRTFALVQMGVVVKSTNDDAGAINHDFAD